MRLLVRPSAGNEKARRAREGGGCWVGVKFSDGDPSAHPVPVPIASSSPRRRRPLQSPPPTGQEGSHSVWGTVRVCCPAICHLMTEVAEAAEAAAAGAHRTTAARKGRLRRRLRLRRCVPPIAPPLPSTQSRPPAPHARRRAHGRPSRALTKPSATPRPLRHTFLPQTASRPIAPHHPAIFHLPPRPCLPSPPP